MLWPDSGVLLVLGKAVREVNYREALVIMSVPAHSEGSMQWDTEKQHLKGKVWPRCQSKPLLSCRSFNFVEPVGSMVVLK